MSDGGSPKANGPPSIRDERGARRRSLPRPELVRDESGLQTGDLFTTDRRSRVQRRRREEGGGRTSRYINTKKSQHRYQHRYQHQHHSQDDAVDARRGFQLTPQLSWDGSITGFGGPKRRKSPHDILGSASHTPEHRSESLNIANWGKAFNIDIGGDIESTATSTWMRGWFERRLRGVEGARRAPFVCALSPEPSSLLCAAALNLARVHLVKTANGRCVGPPAGVITHCVGFGAILDGASLCRVMQHDATRCSVNAVFVLKRVDDWSNISPTMGIII
ncbi:hypothetical protein EG329_009805 [Mollisiaceae sp. DMI_Dod_QoI]|nr:hypothetical protein EG329_009805 [Helotiales sp. DMI_Dod_QoI]